MRGILVLERLQCGEFCRWSLVASCWLFLASHNVVAGMVAAEVEACTAGGVSPAAACAVAVDSEVLAVDSEVVAVFEAVAVLEAAVDFVATAASAASVFVVTTVITPDSTVA